MPTTIATIATPYYRPYFHPNGRHLDVDSTGKRWTVVNDNATIKFYYSSTPGSSWTHATGDITCYANTSPVSFFIDVDDGFHLVYVGTYNYASFRYRYGTASGGTITWSSEVTLGTFVAPQSLDVVAHKEGSDYWAHCFQTESNNGTYYNRVKVTSGTPTVQGSLKGVPSNTGSYTVSLDFNHTGDGKTVAGSSPDVYVVAVTSGAVYYWTFAYSSGPSWVGGTRRDITNGTPYGAGGTGNGVLGFDGTDVMVAYWRSDNTGVDLVQVNLPGETSTNHGKSPDPGNRLFPSLAWDANRNIYLAGADSVNTSPKWCKWDRASTTWDSSWTDIETATAHYLNVSAMRHTQTNAFEVVYSRNLATDDVRWAEATTFPSVGMSGWGLIPIGG